ncbi:collagen-like protein [Maribellus maritimus]|uniref:collagen-like protein n=1 Tax=Maribellus maritimus TaxID=2870838 RepID=UPI001EE9B7FF|nr:collagen-like protein [Maribellus maritimus]MCG6189257.1 collagen-like protein [Maribellus maritimus]
MKCSSTLKLILFGFICAFLASSCVKEGPMGPAGADGQDGADGSDGRDGVDGNVTCLVCHASENMELKKGEFAMSAHSVGAIAVDYAGGRASCAPCHSHEQFVQTMTVGFVAGDITNPSAWQCSTCHGLHKTFEGIDYALRSSDPIVANFDNEVTMDLNGNSNLCAVCHQSRTAPPVDEDQYDRNGALVDAADNGLYAITSTHYGPHHGAQSNVVYGTGFAEIEGDVAYPDAGTAKHLAQASCTGCHMAEFDMAEAQGGHSFIPSLTACNDCHGTNLDDFNYGGVRTEIENLLEEIRDQLIALDVVEYVEADEAYEPKTGAYPIIQVEAFFNWIGLEEDRSMGAHNPQYVKALLLNTKQALEEELLAHE